MEVSTPPVCSLYGGNTAPLFRVCIASRVSTNPTLWARSFCLFAGLCRNTSVIWSHSAGHCPYQPCPKDGCCGESGGGLAISQPIRDTPSSVDSGFRCRRGYKTGEEEFSKVYVRRQGVSSLSMWETLRGWYSMKALLYRNALYSVSEPSRMLKACKVGPSLSKASS